MCTDSEGPVQLELPEQWLWDIIDEFIYQYQVFCTWRSKIASKAQDELSLLAEGGPVRIFFQLADSGWLTLRAFIGLEFIQCPKRPLLPHAEI